MYENVQFEIAIFIHFKTAIDILAAENPIIYYKWSNYWAVYPPSATNSEPVLNDDLSDARNTARLAISSGRPRESGRQ